MFHLSRLSQSIARASAPLYAIPEPAALQRGRRWLKRQGPVRIFLIYRASKAGDYAAGLAFHALLTMFPVFLGLLALLGFLSRSEALDMRVQTIIVETFPAGIQVALANALVSLRHDAGAYGLIATVWLVWSGTGYFSHLEWAMNRIYISNNRSFWSQRLMGVGMICALSTSIAAAVGASWALALNPRLSGLSFFANWLVLTLLLSSMYRVVPNRRVTLRESWPGALVAALLIQLLNLAFPVYLRLTHNVNALGRGLLLFLVLVSWLYLVSQLILLGAVVNRLQLGRLPPIGRSHEISLPGDV
jgi:membrane protein